MPKIKRNITILAIGDRNDYDSFQKFNKEKHFILDKGFEYASVDYKHFLRGSAPAIKGRKVIVFFFFPFRYWNRYIEKRGYKGIYGNRTFHRKFVLFWNKAHRVLKNRLSDKEFLFINPPFLSAFYRDKLNAIKKFSHAGIPQPKLYKGLRRNTVESLLAKGTNLFLKPRYGSMGKGITFLSWENWQTNFMFKNNRIANRRSDHGWKFRDITGNRKFLGALLRKDILVEKAVDALTLKKMRIDMRIYAFLNKIVYVYPRKNKVDRITTNISQGAKGDPGILEFLPDRLIKKVKNVAVKASETSGLSLAGVDIMIDRNFRDVFVLDVNAFPGFPKRRTFNLSQEMVRELAGLCRRGRLRFEKGEAVCR